METVNKVKTYWNEEWAQIETKNPTGLRDYYVSNLGRIKSVLKKDGSEYLRKPVEGSTRYLHIRLSVVNKGVESYYIHKLVGIYFLKKKHEDQQFVIHLDNNKFNNNVSNLKWVSQKELSAWHKKLGTYSVHKNRLEYKMTPTKVRLLLERIKQGKTKKKVIAKSFGITPMQLNRIERGENWGHIRLDD